MGFFLPGLFRLRYATMGGLDPEAFGRQLGALKSFEESAWCSYWNAFARENEAAAEKALQGNPGDIERARDLFVKAMTYAYRKPMSGASEEIYHGVIDHFSGHPRVTPGRVFIVGVSFGGYWAARMAATQLSPQALRGRQPLRHGPLPPMARTHGRLAARRLGCAGFRVSGV